jgi:hypothetical protein
VTPPATSSGSESDEKGNTTLTLKERSRDIDQFFDPAGRGEDGKRRRRCIICRYVPSIFNWSILSHKPHRRKGATKNIVSEVTTLRRHIEAMHEVPYHRFDVDYTNYLSSMHITNGRRKRTLNPSCRKPFVRRRTPRLLKTVQSNSPSNRICPMSRRRKRSYYFTC